MSALPNNGMLVPRASESYADDSAALAAIERECDKACDADYLLDELYGSAEHLPAIDRFIRSNDGKALGDYVLAVRRAMVERMVRRELRL